MGTHIAALDRFWMRVNSRDLDNAFELYHADAVINLAGRTSTGRPAIAQETRNFIAAFPDIVYAVRSRLETGRSVVEEWTATGTHTGVFMGGEATGAKVRFYAISVYEFDGDEVTAERTYLDLSQVLLRTGVVTVADRRAEDIPS